MKISPNNIVKLLKDVEQIFSDQRVLIAGFLVILSLGLMTRLDLLNLAMYPGHGDHAFYYTVAENIVEGKGLQVDYIWTYLSDPESITHTSHDFWMPLTSILISPFLFIFGTSLHAALIPSIIAGLLLSVIVYFLAKKITDSRFVAFCSGSMVLFMPHLLSNSLLTDSPIYYALFVNSTLLLMIKGRENLRYYLLAALFTGITHLTRQDGILLFLTLEFMILTSPIRWKERFTYAFTAACIYIIVLAPLLISNYRIFGFPFPPGPSRSMFVTDFEDVFSYSKELNIRNYMDWGIRNIIQTRINGVFINAKIIYDRFLGTFLKVFSLVGAMTLIASPNKDQKFIKYLPALVYFSLLFLFYSMVVPISSGGEGFMRSSMSLLPIIIIIAFDTISRIVPNRAVVVVLILLVAQSTFGKGIQFTRNQLEANARLGEEMERLNQVIVNELPDEKQDEIVIMTRNPWEVYLTTRIKAIQIPNDDLDTIYEVALKFGADYILLPAPRSALMDIYSGVEKDERFVLKSEVPDSDLILFEIK